ncbi:hypothetical protein [Reyranella sp.]|uniref:hypothetical protein n=1 Tax=Reyranella sp. TaxID=1929291 RepID=UPI003D10DDE5
MSNPSNFSRHELLRLLDRLDDVDPKCMPDVIVGKWAVADPEARRTIEEEIDRLPKRKKPN